MAKSKKTMHNDIIKGSSTVSITSENLRIKSKEHNILAEWQSPKTHKQQYKLWPPDIAQE